MMSCLMLDLASTPHKTARTDAEMQLMWYGSFRFISFLRRDGELIQALFRFELGPFAEWFPI
jgi:hypothetical protein